MTTREVIKQADALRPNCIEAEAKSNILRELESEYAELMGMELPENLWPEDQTLLMPAPHDNSYVWYLCAGIDLMNAETDLYANDKVVANSKVSEAMAWWRRHNRPPHRGNWKV